MPLFIIEEIYKTAYKEDFKFQLAQFYNISSTGESYHLLDFVRKNYVRRFFKETRKCTASETTGSGNSEKELLQPIVSPTATRLHAAGVKFQVIDTTDQHHVDIGDVNEEEKSAQQQLSFDVENCILRIPKIVTDDSAQSLIRNMIALERCMCPTNGAAYFTDYNYFLDCLINTPEDVQLLADARVVENWMGCEAVCEMFNTSNNRVQVVPSKYLCKELSQQLIDHCNKDWNCYIAMLRNKYFRHPWAVLSFGFAIFLMLLSVAQVVIGVLTIP